MADTYQRVLTGYFTNALLRDTQALVVPVVDGGVPCRMTLQVMGELRFEGAVEDTPYAIQANTGGMEVWCTLPTGDRMLLGAATADSHVILPLNDALDPSETAVQTRYCFNGSPSFTYHFQDHLMLNHLQFEPEWLGNPYDLYDNIESVQASAVYVRAVLEYRKPKGYAQVLNC